MSPPKKKKIKPEQGRLMKKRNGVEKSLIIISAGSLLTFIIFVIFFSETTFTIENLIAILALVIGLSSLNFSVYFSKKTLEQTQENLIIQLTHDDRKKAIVRICEIINGAKEYFILRNELNKFLSSCEGQYIPIGLRKSIRNEIKKMEKYIEDKGIYKTLKMYEEKGTREEMIEHMTEEMKKLFDPTERVNYLLNDKLIELKKNVDKKSKKKLIKPRK